MNSCENCVYRWKMYSSQKTSYCGYFMDTGKKRFCPMEACGCFEEGTPYRRRRLIFSDKYYSGECEMTVNDLIENFRINVEDGGVLITDNNGYSCSLTKNMLEYIGTDEILGSDLYAGILFVRIEKPIASLRRM